MNVEDIIKATNGKLLTGNLEEKCENFCTDTRKIQKGDVYVGLKGEKFNGNEYYKEALEKGAKVAVISEIVPILIVFQSTPIKYPIITPY